jgi:hypothetical protein
VKIKYTKHAELKLIDLSELGIKINKVFIRKIINKPAHIDKTSDYPNLIFSGNLSKGHILRIVCKEEDGIIKVITFYPAKKGRYFI